MVAYNSNSSEAAVFSSLIEQWLRDNPTVDFAQLHYALDSLQYLMTVDRSPINIPERGGVEHVFCAEKGCDTTSHTPGACLLNFAHRGSPPLWYCRRHHKETAGYPPPGWIPADVEENRAETMAAWNKLTNRERTLLNRNIVGTASKGD